MTAEEASTTEARDVEGTRTDRVCVRILKERESVGLAWGGAPTFFKLRAAWHVARRDRGKASPNLLGV
ncbi:unnamed protein product [marine sediment metagenome]|uniref:Uncharacterized protein n=1 Tax=marine sediment metagenome TaxID=412755 RepID=X1R121_9ZZZZ